MVSYNRRLMGGKSKANRSAKIHHRPTRVGWGRDATSDPYGKMVAMSIPAGWYPDPAEPETQKFWDGEQWTDPPGTRTHVADTPPTISQVIPNVGATGAQAPPDAERSAHGGNTPENGEMYRLASHGSRFAARMIDIGVLFVLNLLVNGWLLIQLIDEIAPEIARVGRASADGGFEVAEFSDRAGRLMLVITVISVALWLAYEVPSLLQRGQTLGKRVLGIRVIGLGTSTLRLSTALRRWAVMGLPTLFPLACAVIWLIVDSAWCLKDRPARQCLHDKAASTVVVDV